MSRILASLLLVSALACASPGGGSGSYSAADFQPVASGTSWDFLEDSKGKGHQQVAGSGEPVNGVATSVIVTSSGRDEGNKLWITNDAKGLRLHRSLEPDKEGRDLVFDPPVVLLPAGFDVGRSWKASGSIGSSPVFGNYESEAKVVGIQDVKVPGGSFKTVRVESSLVLTGFMAGSPTRLVTTTTNQYARGVGVVHSKGVVDGEPFLSELTTTSVKLCPDVAGGGGALTGCP